MMMVRKGSVVLVLLCFVAGRSVAESLSDTVDELASKLPEVTVQETVINITPQTRVYLPSGSLDMALRQEFRRTTVDFSSRYDFLDSFMGFKLDFLYAFPSLSAGVALADNIDFTEVFTSSQFLQRVQSISPYVRYPLGHYAGLRGGIRLEKTYTDAIATLERLDFGRNIVGEAGYWWDTVEETTATPRGCRFTVDMEHSFNRWGSDYDYTQAEMHLSRFIRAIADHYVEYEFEFGYPLALEERPLTALYYAGGYRRLRGYDYKEFYGNAIVYTSIAYNVPLSGGDKSNLFGVPFSFVTWNVFVEGAKVGERDILDDMKNSKWALGTGFGYKMLVLKRLPLKLDFAFAKAFENRPPQFYFTVSSAWLTWGSN